MTATTLEGLNCGSNGLDRSGRHVRREQRSWQQDAETVIADEFRSRSLDLLTEVGGDGKPSWKLGEKAEHTLGVGRVGDGGKVADMTPGQRINYCLHDTWLTCRLLLARPRAKA